MSATRIATFELMAQQQPDNTMVWYGLASEYSKIDRWNDAVIALEKVIVLNPDYTSAWQMLGTAYVNLNLPEKALEVWNRGIEAADKTGAWKARDHMKRLIEESKDSSPFCHE